MQREFYFDNNPRCVLWDWLWSNRTIEQELEACEIESPPRELFLSYLPKEGKIVDAGCGFGKWVIYLKRQGYDVMGIDDNKLAVAKVKDFDDSLQVELGDILDIHYPDNSFNAYISMGVVEHFEDGPTLALEEAYRVLRPNGLIFVSVPTVNLIRRLVRRPLRNTINAFYTSWIILRLIWGESKRNAIREAILYILPWKRGKYYHFLEYRYSKSELETFLRQCNFEVMRTEPHDYYGSKDHAVGLIVDFPFLKARDGANFRVNFAGKLISRLLNRISPWIACSSVLCVGKSLKKES
jgi:SAM-dependent methyltransferase